MCVWARSVYYTASNTTIGMISPRMGGAVCPARMCRHAYAAGCLRLTRVMFHFAIGSCQMPPRACLYYPCNMFNAAHLLCKHGHNGSGMPGNTKTRLTRRATCHCQVNCDPKAGRVKARAGWRVSTVHLQASQARPDHAHHRSNPGHSIAVAKTLKSSPWAAAGEKGA